MTTIFEYKAYLAQIDQTNSYTKLRKMYKSFIDSNEMNNFYRVHCAAKLVSKFKSLTKSSIINGKDYCINNNILNTALSDLSSIDDLKNLIKDWPNKDLNTSIMIPYNSSSLINLSKYVNFDEMFINECGLNNITFSYDLLGRTINLESKIKFPLAIVHELKSIKHTNLYRNLLDKHVQEYHTLNYNLDKLLQLKSILNDQIESIEETIKSIEEAVRE